MPDEPEAPSGPPPYPGPSSPPPESGPPRYPGGGAPDSWYEPPRQPGGGPGGYYYPPGSPPPGPYGAPPSGGPGGPGTAVYASYLARVGGLLLDSILLSLVSLLYLLPAHALRTTHTVVNGVSTAHLNLPPGTVIVTLIIGALYAGLMIGLRGQTLGMMAVRVRAVDAATGQLIGVPRAIGRDLFERLLGFLFFFPLALDLLFPLWDRRRQTLHDKVTNTVVVRA